MASIEEFIEGEAGRLFVRSWLPAAQARAVMVICHGFNAHSGTYAQVGRQFAAKGLTSCALDLRGSGRSDGERSYVDSFDDYVADLHSLIDLAKSREPDAPFFLLGHSAGGICRYSAITVLP